jgi:hypothetical protein
MLEFLASVGATISIACSMLVRLYLLSVRVWQPRQEGGARRRQ